MWVAKCCALLPLAQPRCGSLHVVPHRTAYSFDLVHLYCSFSTVKNYLTLGFIYSSTAYSNTQSGKSVANCVLRMCLPTRCSCFDAVVIQFHNQFGQVCIVHRLSDRISCDWLMLFLHVCRYLVRLQHCSSCTTRMRTTTHRKVEVKSVRKLSVPLFAPRAS